MIPWYSTIDKIVWEQIGPKINLKFQETLVNLDAYLEIRKTCQPMLSTKNPLKALSHSTLKDS